MVKSSWQVEPRSLLRLWKPKRSFERVLNGIFTQIRKRNCFQKILQIATRHGARVADSRAPPPAPEEANTGFEVDSPTQVRPSPVKPSAHAHVYEGAVLVQTALTLQSFRVLSKHSLMSACARTNTESGWVAGNNVTLETQSQAQLIDFSALQTLCLQRFRSHCRVSEKLFAPF